MNRNKVLSLVLALAIMLAGITAGMMEQPATGQANQIEDFSTSVYIPLVKFNDPWVNPLGVETHRDLSTHEPFTSKIAELGSGWVRLNDRISWQDLQPVEGGPIDWDSLALLDDELRSLQAVGATPIMIVDDYPSWATIDPNKSCGAIKEEAFDDFAAFMFELVARYSSPEFNVKHWELGNEVDVDPDLVPDDSVFGCWGDADQPNYGGEYYGQFLMAVTPSIRIADPQAKVWIGGFILNKPDSTVGNPGAPRPELFFRGILEAGAAPYFDVVPFHAHTQYYGAIYDTHMGPNNAWLTLGGGVNGKAQFLRNIMAEYGVDKPVIVNEIGVGCDQASNAACMPVIPEIFYEFKAMMLPRIAVRAVSADIMGMVWYTLEGPGWRAMGLLDDQNQPQKAYHAMEFLAERLRGATYLGTIDYGAGTETYVFRLGGSKQLQIAWTFSNVTIPIMIPQDSFVAAYDLTGNPITPLAVDTNYQLDLTFSPIYILRYP